LCSSFLTCIFPLLQIDNKNKFRIPWHNLGVALSDILITPLYTNNMCINYNVDKDAMHVNVIIPLPVYTP